MFNIDESFFEGILEIFKGSSTTFIFEDELGTPSNKPDFSLCITKKELKLLMEHWTKNGHVDSFLNNEIWRRLLKFLSVWGERNSMLNNHISDVWFEFDYCQLMKKLPEACFFLSPINLNKRKWGDQINTNWLFEEVLSILFNGRLDNRAKSNVNNCILALPANGIVFQLGAMLARESNQIRLCTSMPCEQYLDYLKVITWKGSYSFLENIFKSLESYVDGFFIDIDVGEIVSSTIGIECYFRSGNGMRKRIEKFLVYLIRKGLCIKEKADLIVQWLDNPFEHSKVTNSNEVVINKTFSHFKLVVNYNNLINTKVYLALFHLT